MIKKKLLCFNMCHLLSYLIYKNYSLIFYFINTYINSYIDNLKNLNICINLYNNLYLTLYSYIISIHLYLNTNLICIKGSLINKSKLNYTLVKAPFVYKNSQEHLTKNKYIFIFYFFFKNINVIFLNYLITYFYKKKIKLDYNSYFYIEFNNKV